MDLTNTIYFIVMFARMNSTFFFVIYSVLTLLPLALIKRKVIVFRGVIVIAIVYIILLTGIINAFYTILLSIMVLFLCRIGKGHARVVLVIGSLLYILITEIDLMPLSPFMPILLGVMAFRGWMLTEDYDGQMLKGLAYMLYYPIMLMGPFHPYSKFDRFIPTCENFKIGAKRIILSIGIFILMFLFYDKLFYVYIHDGYTTYGILSLYGIVFIYAHALRFFLYLYGFFAFVRGISIVLGIELMDNFPSIPYLAKDIREFWRLWNATVTAFFIRYLYIPLGGNRKHRYLNVLAVFGFSGLWHAYMYVYEGSGYSAIWFLIWGLYCGIIFVILDTILTHNHSPKIVNTFAIVTAIGFSWVIFGVPLII